MNSIAGVPDCPAKNNTVARIKDWRANALKAVTKF
jgi:hypothetical protein